MSYKALYRKYRSSTFDEIYGQSHIVKTLQNSIKNKNIGHAYLFCGPRGTGKTSMAKLFAKALNCDNENIEICNECENCRLINSNSHPDVIELDAASNSGVDDIRSIIEKVSYSPIKGKYKVYIIDEVHMLSNSAFNALLKTLEEPPSYVVFILATTEPHKVLPTILSRCQRYDFTKIPNEEIKKRLLDIMEKEDIKCDNDALDQLIDLADGGLRDALSILDQLVAFCNKDIKYDDLISVFGLVSKQERYEFLSALFYKDTVKILSTYSKFSESGVNIKLLNDYLINDLKDLLLFKMTNSLSNIKSISKENIMKLDQLSTIKSIQVLLDQFLKCCNDFKNVSNIYSYYEIVLLELMSTVEATKTNIVNPVIENKMADTKPVNEDKAINEQPLPQKEITREVIAPITQEVETKPKAKPSMIVFEHLEGISSEDLLKYSDELLIKAIVKSSKSDKLKLMEHWSEIDSFSTDAIHCKICNALSITTIFSLCDELLILQTRNKQSEELLNMKDNQVILSTIFGKILGRKIRVYTLSDSKSIDITTLFLNLRQVGKLPNKETIGELF